MGIARKLVLQRIRKLRRLEQIARNWYAHVVLLAIFPEQKPVRLKKRDLERRLLEALGGVRHGGDNGGK
jgi:hypothetical protein